MLPNLTPNAAQWLTLAVVVAVTISVLGYDIAVIRAYGAEASISRVMRRLFASHPTLFVAVVFWIGVLVGHVLLPAE